MDDETGWLTITEIARRLSQPPSTVRYWRNQYRSSLDARADDPKHPTYRLVAFERLAALMKQAETPPAEIRRTLAALRASIPTDRTGAHEGQLLDVLERIAEYLKRLVDLLEARQKET